MSSDTENKIDALEVTTAENNPAVSELLDAVRQQEEKSNAGFHALREAISQLADSLAEQAKAAATAAAMKLAAEKSAAQSSAAQSSAQNTAVESLGAEPSEDIPVVDFPESDAETELPQPVAELPEPIEAVPTAAPMATAVVAAPQDSSWEQILLGNELASDPNLALYRQRLVSGLSNGDAAATGLVGHLLMFRALPADKMPKVLKEVGEAYYRWSPHTLQPDPMRDSVIHWLERVCEACGVQNKIRVVQPGDRFDSTRHNAKERGIEVSDVFGWIVLRDNGKVYSKAIVAVK
jgi:hypothetical protein